MFASAFKHSNKELLPPGAPPMWTCSFQHGENFVGSVEKLSRDEVRRRIGLASADNQHSGSAAGQGAAEQRSAALEWPTMHAAAYHGLAGEVVHTIGPHTEGDPVALLIQFLTCAGNIIGNRAYYQVEGTHHHANLFSVLVGESSKARKGTAWDRISGIVRLADDRWYSERTKNGLSSGEGF